MKPIKRKHYLIKSVYVKYIFLFIGSLWIGCAVAFMLVSPYAIKAIQNSYNQSLRQDAESVRNFCNATGIDADRLIRLSSSEKTDIRVFASYQAITADPKYGRLITKAQYRQMQNGQLIKGFFASELPYVGVFVNGKAVLLHPVLKDNLLAYLGDVLKGVLFISAGVGSVLIALASIIILHPIRKLSKATKEVAKGNFDVHLPVGSGDEIGRLTENFNRMTADLKNIEYLRKDFITSVSHEFKTPITSIQGFARLIRDKNLPRDRQDEYADIIVSESGRLANLSSNLLRLSKLENQEIQDKYTRFSLDEQIRRVVLLFEHSWSAKQTDLDIDLCKAAFYGDEELMRQVWINLISNAVKFTGQGGRIGIALHCGPERVVVRVSDNGIGISEEAKAHIFEKFYKADRSRSGEGNGLGLAIVKKIVELHNGSIRFESESGRGTTFIVELPLQQG